MTQGLTTKRLIFTRTTAHQINNNPCSKPKLLAKLKIQIWPSACVLSCFNHVWHCDTMVCCPQGSSVHGISQARILEWVTLSFSRGSFWRRDRTRISYVSCLAGRFFTTEPPGKPRDFTPLVILIVSGALATALCFKLSFSKGLYFHSFVLGWVVQIRVQNKAN